ncbi:hypothetical protein Lfu02_15930 [Longispora fulva]|uniref:Uncharacterized protein n=1 Tax=Longispora fulva TaxID=619741 RepID=A0A8J7H224_9ACTN|nr:hypothetical protein [Longispora fulva]MBG6140398.1 hypothetical protein [Longispora fulva]GIG57221.1 hypothetical protein Lfu02_15930 [Longispora fulva]
MGSVALPDRPLSVGELLDAAVELLRTRAKPLIGIGLILALLEQGALAPLWAARQPFWEAPTSYLPWLACGLGFESLAIGLLAGYAGRAARISLGGTPGGIAAPVLTAVLVAVTAAVSSLLFGVPWLVAYALLGFAVPVAVIDRTGNSFGRSARLVLAGSLRAGMIRLLGYCAWLGIRLAFALAAKTLLDQVFDLTDPLYVAAIWALINGIAYPALACLDVVAHLENRIRVEGLDVELGRARATGRPADDVLRAGR